MVFRSRNSVAAAVMAALALGSLAGCGSAASSAAGRPAATATATATHDPVADCAGQIDYWITTEYLQGKPDRGDYQEMGLGSAEGLALRQLEQHLAQGITAFPAPAPANLHAQELAACDAAGASATASGTKPPVWP